jgi:hypothetical protein
VHPEPATGADFEVDTDMNNLDEDLLNRGPTGRGVTVEEVEDEDAPGRTPYRTRWTQTFEEGDAGAPKDGLCEETIYEQIRREKTECGEAPWAPFESQDDWELARWLMKTGVSQSEINNFLKLAKVSQLFVQ